MARTSYFAGDALLDNLYTTYGTQPTSDPEAGKVYQRLVEAHQRMYAGLNKGEIDRELRTLSEQVKLYKIAREAATDLAETRGKGSRVTSQNITKLKTTLLDGQVAMSKTMNAKGPAYTVATNAATAAEKQGGDKFGGAMAALASWNDSFGKPLAPDSADNVPVMNQMSILATGKPLNEVSVEELVAKLGNAAGGQVGDYARTNLTAAKMRYEDMLSTNKFFTDGLKKANSYDSAMNNLAAGSPGAKALNAELADLADNLQPALLAATGRSAADIEAQRELTVNRNAEIEESQARIDRAEARAYGTQKKTAQEKMGRLMATPQFQEWAAGNGYKVGDYFITDKGALASNPGPDDKAALRMFLYQAENPGKYGPLLASKSTGVLVKVTAQDPEEKARVMAAYKGSGGTYYLDAKGNLTMPGAAEDRLEREGYIPSVEIDMNSGTFRKPDGSMMDVDGNPVAAAPAGAKFVPAVKNDASGKPERYLTEGDVSDAEKVKALTTVPPGAPDKMGGAGSPEEEAALEAYVKGAPYTEATEDQVQQVWTGTYTGYLDRPHASDAISGKAGSSTIKLDGGRVTIPGGRPATIEVLEEREPGAIAGVVRAFNKSMPDAHVESLKAQGKIQELPREEAVRLAKEQNARFFEEPPPKPEVATEAAVPVTTPGGQQGVVSLPIGSRAVSAAGEEGRMVLPIASATVEAEVKRAAEATAAAAAASGKAPAAKPSAAAAPAAAPTAPTAPAAPATKPATGAAPSTAMRVSDKEGNVFDVSLEKITLVSQPAGAKKSTKREWTSKDPAFETVMARLEKDNPMPEAEAKPATSALPKAGTKTKVAAPAETAPEIGSRGAAAVVVPKKVTPTTDEQDVERGAALRAAEQARKAAAVPFKEKESPDGEAYTAKTAEGQRREEALALLSPAAREQYARELAARRLAPKPESAPTKEALQAGGVIARNRDARLAPEEPPPRPKPTSFSFFKPRFGPPPLAPEPEKME